MQRLSIEAWRNIFRNLADIEENPQDYNGEYEEFGAEVEVIWLDPGDALNGEWALCHGYEMFEDGFESEGQAQARLTEIEKLVK